jgi:lysozyme
MPLEGIDVSRWQATTPSLAGREFAFVRATYGTYPDGRYEQHAANVRKAGKVLGAYAFGRNMSVAAQVTAFLATAGEADLFALDLEKDGSSARMTDAQARAFIAGVQATGRRVGLYHSESGFPELGQDFDWVANWSREPARHWDIWQYTSDGHIAGYDGRLDLNRFNGTLADLRELADRKETSMGAKVDLTGTVLGLATFPAGTKVIRVSDAKTRTFSPATTKRAVYATGEVGGTAVYLVEWEREAYTIAQSRCTFEPRVTPSVEAAVTAERERIALAEAARLRSI